MANSMDQENEANPVAEIFDEMFTLLQDLETRSVAAFEYMKEQGGATDEKLAPYLDRAAAASDVRWRAARARMEYLLAPALKSSTEVAQDEKAGAGTQPQPKEKDARIETGKAQVQEENQRKESGASNDLDDEFALAHPATKSSDPEDDYTQDAKLAADTKSNTKEAKGSERKQRKAARSSGAETQASALAGREKSESPNNDKNPKTQTPSDNEKSPPQSSDWEKQKGQRVAR